MPKKISRSKQPATKGDVDRAIGELANASQKGFFHVDEQFTEVRKDITSLKNDVAELKDDVSVLKDDVIILKGDVKNLKSGQAAILEVVKSIDQQLKTHKELPTQVARLERAVFR